MNETRGNARTKPMRENLKEREINSLKDSEKTNDELLIIDLAYIIIDGKNNRKYHYFTPICPHRKNSFIRDLRNLLTKYYVTKKEINK